MIAGRGLPESVKLSRLLMLLSGPALLAVKNLVGLPHGYKRAKIILKNRYGQANLIAAASIEAITDGPPLTGNEGGKYREFADRVNTTYHSLRSINKLHLVGLPQMKSVVNRLPYRDQKAWQERTVRMRPKVPKLRHLVEYIEVKAEVANDKLFANPTNSKLPPKKGKAFKAEVESECSMSEKGRDGFAMTASHDAKTPGTVAQRVEKPGVKCAFCDGSHFSYKCEKYHEQSVNERRRMVFVRRLCYNCLRAGHHARDCTSSRTCMKPECGKRHHTTLHIDFSTMQQGEFSSRGSNPSQEPTVGNSLRGQQQTQVAKDKVNSTDAPRPEASSNGALGKSKAVVQCLPLVVRNDDGKFVETYAMLDSGSNCTFVSAELAGALELKGQPIQMDLKTIQGRCALDTTRVSVYLQDLKRKHPCLYADDVVVVKFMESSSCPISLETKEKFPHLQTVSKNQLPDRRIYVIVGTDVPRAFLQEKVRIGNTPQDPLAIKTQLG